MKVVYNKLICNIKGYAAEGNAAQHEKVDPEKSCGACSNEDNVELSTKARQLQAVQALVDAVPDVREAKVADLKARIENGTYQVKGDKIALALIRESVLNRYF